MTDTSYKDISPEALAEKYPQAAQEIDAVARHVKEFVDTVSKIPALAANVDENLLRTNLLSGLYILHHLGLSPQQARDAIPEFHAPANLQSLTQFEIDLHNNFLRHAPPEKVAEAILSACHWAKDRLPTTLHTRAHLELITRYPELFKEMAKLQGEAFAQHAISVGTFIMQEVDLEVQNLLTDDRTKLTHALEDYKKGRIQNPATTLAVDQIVRIQSRWQQRT